MYIKRSMWVQAVMTVATNKSDRRSGHCLTFAWLVYWCDHSIECVWCGCLASYIYIYILLWSIYNIIITVLCVYVSLPQYSVQSMFMYTTIYYMHTNSTVAHRNISFAHGTIRRVCGSAIGSAEHGRERAFARSKDRTRRDAMRNYARFTAR